MSVREVIGDAAYGRAIAHLERALAGEQVSFENRFELPIGPRDLRITMIPSRGDEPGSTFSAATSPSSRRCRTSERRPTGLPNPRNQPRLPGAGAGAPECRDPGPAVSRSRRLQADQRSARPSRRRRSAATLRQRAECRGTPRRHGGALGWRRVHHHTAGPAPARARAARPVRAVAGGHGGAPTWPATCCPSPAALAVRSVTRASIVTSTICCTGPTAPCTKPSRPARGASPSTSELPSLQCKTAARRPPLSLFMREGISCRPAGRNPARFRSCR